MTQCDQRPSDDLTIQEVLTDPMILQMMKADRISVSRMQDFLQDAARRQTLVRRPRLSTLGASLRAGCCGSA